MSRFDTVFAPLNSLESPEKPLKKALITYLCCGDPDAQSSVDLALACAGEGADVLELGMPFSDPTADGPAIARASQRALANGGGFEATLRAAKAIRERTAVPMILFGYYNPLFVRGEPAVVDRVAEAGIDAFLIVDLPLDESVSLREHALKRGLSVVPLIAPTTPEARIEAVGEMAKRFPIPFVYCVSMMGVTGGTGALDVLGEASRHAAHVRAVTKRPSVVGFGIDSPEAARVAAAESCGIVVGSAIVRAIEQATGAEARLEAVKQLVRGLRSAA